jgi:hypothetical protein
VATAQQQLDGFVKKYSPEIEKLGRAALAQMRKRLPGAVVMVYDNYNALAVGFGPEGKGRYPPRRCRLRYIPAGSTCSS